MNRYTLEVLGTPQPKGSTRAFVVKGRLHRARPTIGARSSSLRQTTSLASDIFGARYAFAAVNTELRRVVGSAHFMERSDAAGPRTEPRGCALRQRYRHGKPSPTAFAFLLDSILAAGSTT